MVNMIILKADSEGVLRDENVSVRNRAGQLIDAQGAAISDATTAAENARVVKQKTMETTTSLMSSTLTSM